MKFFSENLSFKLIAFAVAFVLWMSMIGSKDSALTKGYQLQVLLPANTELAHPIPDLVRVEISGPRVSLKKLGQNVSVYTVDLSSEPLGQVTVQLSPEGVSLPIGTKVISVDPKEFIAVIQKIKKPSSEEE
ncbi:hypothetical protein GW916_00780 [bacterium]|nr:hypothetical protein [bacterium]